jgi:FixJ family two-component response regulator
MAKQLQTPLRRIAMIFTTGHGDVPMIVKKVKSGVLAFRTKFL